MTIATTTQIVPVVEKAIVELEEMARIVEAGVASAATAFKGLADHSDAVLNLAGAIVSCVESEEVASVLPRVQSLGAAAKQFIAHRIEATAGILETVAREVKLLDQLSEVAGLQEGTALEIKALSVLTNIEVARIGTVGGGFRYLANELANFSKSVIEDTQVLASQTNTRRASVKETRVLLATELPHMREELARIETGLGKALEEVDASLSELLRAPAQFRTGVEDVARQITGVVSAIQNHDINRQMSEHVRESLALISSRMRDAGEGERELAQELPLAYAGLAIQSCQLRTIKDAVADWTSRTRTCSQNILRVSAAEVVGIGPVVLEQEHKLSRHLAQIEHLEHQSQVYSRKIQQSLAGLSNLAQLVGEHLRRSQSIRDRLRLLAFNSIIEADHLGVQAGAILAISQSIKEISEAWGRVTDQSEQARQQIQSLVEHTNTVLEAFSDAANQGLQEAETKTRAALDGLRQAAEFAGQQAHEMQAATERMQAKVSEVGRAGELLDASFSRGYAALNEIEELTQQLESDYPGVKHQCDAAEAERVFAAFYTTELEREVLRAFLTGGALPVAQASTAGNSVELF